MRAKAFSIILTILAVINVEAAEIRRAKILCERQNPGDVYYAEGEVTFSQGYDFYGPARNTFEGHMGFAFVDALGSSVSYTKIQGNQIVPGRYNEPEFWTFVAISRNGEIIQMNLRSEGFHKNFFFGEIKTQNGQNFTARCQIQVNKP